MMIQLRAFAEALFSSEAGAPPEERIDWLMTEMEDYLERAGPSARFIFRFSLVVVSLIAPLLIGHLQPLRGLSVGERVRALTRMEASFASAPVLAVKAFLCVVYYEHPDVQREVGHLGASTFPMALRR